MKRVWFSRSNQAGFTLPELLVVLILFVVILMVSAPHLRTKSQDGPTRNAERRLDISHILQAVNKYYTDTGSLPSAISTKEQVIGSATDQANLCSALVPKYISDMPLEPILGAKQIAGRCDASGQVYVTAYTIQRSADGSSVTVRSPLVENNGDVIEVTRHY